MAQEFPFKFHNLSEEDKTVINGKIPYDFVQIGDKKWFTPGSYKQYAAQFYNFELKPDDVWLLGYIRCGTTLTQEIVWLIANNLDFEKARQIPILKRFPSLEHVTFNKLKGKVPFDDKMQTFIEQNYEDLFQTDRQRFIKAHIPLELLPQKLPNFGCKVIYLIRDPRDVLVSNFVMREKFSKEMDLDSVKFKDFWKSFKAGLAPWAPYFEHVKEAWRLRNEENVSVVFYEDLMDNQVDAIKKIGTFLGKKLSTEDCEKISEFCKAPFTKTRKLDEIEKEKGRDENVVYERDENKWKKYFVGELEQEVNEWIGENLKDENILYERYCKSN